MREKLAVIGMDISFGKNSGIDIFDLFVYEGWQQFEPIEEARKSALGVESTSQVTGMFVDLPGEDAAEIAASRGEKALQLITGVIQNAMDNAQIDLAATSHVELIVCSDGSVDEAAIAQLQQRFKKIYKTEGFSEAITLAQKLLADKKADCVTIAAAHLWEKLPTNVAQENSLNTLAFDEQFHGYLCAEGAGAVVLKTKDRALMDGNRVWSYVEAVVSGKSLARAFQSALDKIDIAPASIEYIETTAGNDPALRQIEIDALATVFADSQDDMTCALGSVKATIGDMGDVSSIAAFIKTILCINNRYIPMIPHWSAPQDLQSWQGTRCYFPTDSRAWFESKKYLKRLAAVSMIDRTDRASVILLAEDQSSRKRTNRYLKEVSWHFLPVVGNSEHELQLALRHWNERLEPTSDLTELRAVLNESLLASQQHQSATYAAVVIGEDKEELIKELHIMAKGIATVFHTKAEWKTPKGSYFTPDPVGKEGDVAFVYPGVGAAYIGLGQDLFHMFPDAFNNLDRMARDASKMVKENILYPRSRTKLNLKERKERDNLLRKSIATISECGIGIAYLMTNVFRNTFNLQPHAAVGYSMGEVTMYTAVDAWTDAGCLSNRLAEYPTFNHNLTGRLLTLREHWGIPFEREDESMPLWEMFSLRADPREVQLLVDKEERCYLAIINTPDNVVIGGEPASCARIIEKLGGSAMSLGIVSAIHSEPAKREYDRMVALYSVETSSRIDLRLYSSSIYKSVPHKSKAIANSIARSFTEQLDFPKLINKMYEDGVRIFVEIGADRSCCTWIDRIMKTEKGSLPHICVPINGKGTEDHVSITRALAKLFSHRADVDISPLFA